VKHFRHNDTKKVASSLFSLITESNFVLSKPVESGGCVKGNWVWVGHASSGLFKSPSGLCFLFGPYIFLKTIYYGHCLNIFLSLHVIK